MALPQINLLVNGFGTDYAAGTATAYVAGTTTLATWYTDSGGTTPAANPYTLDAYGKATLYCGTPIKLDVKNSTGTSAPGFPIDNLIFSAAGEEDWQFKDATSGNVTVDLTTADNAAAKQTKIIKTDASANTVTITSTGSGFTGGVSSIVLSLEGECVSLIPDAASNLWVLA